MAKAKLKEQTKAHVVLRLTLAEATTLRQVANRVSGSPGRSRRAHMDRIADALDAAVVLDEDGKIGRPSGAEAGIYFRDEEGYDG